MNTRRFILLFSLFLTVIQVNAYDFSAEGFYFDIIAGTNEVFVHPAHAAIASKYSGDIVIPAKVSHSGVEYTVVGIGEYAFTGSGITSIDLPETIRFIDDYAFMSCSKLTSIELPNKLESIGKAIISSSGITHIKIPSSVTKIAKRAFGPDINSAGCQLESIDLTESSITEIPEDMFWSCKLKSIVLPSSINIIGKGAFRDCTNLSSVSLPPSIKTIDAQAFYSCSALESINLPEGLTYIGNYAFNSTHLKSVKIPSTIHEINIGAFHNCTKLTSLDLPETLTSIGENAFGYCLNLNDIVLPSSLKSIGKSAFYRCQSLTTINLPPSLASIGQYAFSSCSKLVEVDSKITEPFDNSAAFTGISSNAILYVPVGTKDKYLNTYGWGTSYFKQIIEKADTYSLSITASGNGSAIYSSTTIKNKTQSFTVNEGTSATVTFSPDSGYRIASLKVNNTDVTSSVANNKYTISNISANTTLSVTFEAIPPTTYTLSITASGSGSASYNSTSIKNKTQSFTVNEGTSAIVTFSPDSGYRIASVKVNNTDVTSSVSNNKYTISNISTNTTLSVTFEAIPPTTYTLSITASGNGSASYSSTTIKNNTQSFTVNEGTSATVTFSPDSGYRIVSVKVNSTDVTSSVSNNKYTISNISANTTLSVTFEAIPPTTYTLSITASGNGSASYSSTTIKNKTQSFTVNEGTSAIVTFSPDSGYRIASVKVNNTDVTSSVSNNKYTISNISANTTLSVTFEAIPPTTYTLSITASGNGSASYSSTTARNQTRTFTVNEGTSATITFTPDAGYRIASVSVNNSNVTSSLSNNKYTISNIKANTTVKVTFEAITYTLSITSTGNGYAAYNSTSVRNQTRTFNVNEGNSATVTFNPDNGNSISSVKVDGKDVTSQISSNRYVINSMSANTTVAVTFVEDVNALTVNGINYTVVSQANKTVKVTGGDYGQVLTVPATVTSNGVTWTITGIEDNALKDNKELAAVVWNPTAAFTATVSNPNLLLYVKSSQYAPSAIKNVIVNGTASSITLVDVASGNGFYCPQRFTAQKISYTHNYNMMTGIGESKGWETIALPFDVRNISHSTKGNIIPFANWNHQSSAKPFWLYELAGTGFVEASEIKAYTPYIISMPNNPKYDNPWLLKGSVTFESTSVIIEVTEDLKTATYSDRTFVPNFSDKAANEGLYALNVINDYVTNNSGMTEGSKFVLNMRQIHPFEAYMTTTSNASQMFGIFEDMTTSIRTVDNEEWTISNDVYDLQGRKVTGPKKGVYIKNGKKLIIK